MTQPSRSKTQTGLPLISHQLNARTILASDWLSAISDPPQRLLALLQLATDVLSALQAKHENGEVFLGLRDETIFIQLPQRQAILAGRETEAMKHGQGAANDSPLTLERAIFLAPEQTGILQRPMGPPTDLYSLGVFLYRSISGIAPIPSSNLNELMLGQMTKPVTCLRWRGKTVSRCVDEFIQRLLKREPRERYQTAKAALADLNKILDWMDGIRTESVVLGTEDRRERLCEPSFVGREQWIERFIHSLSADKPILPRWIILSKSGDGKSRLMDEFAKEAMARDALVLRMKGLQSEKSHPLESFSSLSSDLELQCQSNPDFCQILKEGLTQHEESMRPLLPWLFKSAALDANVGPEKFAGQRLKRGVETLLELLHQQPKRVVMLIDDLDDLDELSYDLLIGWLQSKKDGILDSLMLVATGLLCNRDQLQVDLDTVPDILAPLSPSSITDLLSSMIGEFPKNVLELSANAANGNPFLAISLLQGVIESGNVQLRDGAWGCRVGQTITLQGCGQGASSLATRTVGLPDLVVKFLTAGAILGASFRFAEAADLSCIDAILAQEAVELSLQRQLVWSDSQQQQIGFVHEDVRQSFLSGINEHERTQLHLEAANKILCEDANRYYELAYHYDAAGSASEAIHFSTLAAKHSQRQYANDLAIRYYRMAEKWIPISNRDQKRNTLESIGEVFLSTGEYDAAGAAFEEALTFADRAIDRTQLTGRIGDVEFKRGRMRQAADQYVAALELSGVRVARTMSRMVLGLLWQSVVQVKHTVVGLPIGRKAATPIQRLRWTLFSRLAHTYWFSRGAIWTLFAHLSGMNDAEKHLETPELAKSYSEHAPVCSLLGFFQRAEVYSKRSLKIRCDQGDLWGQGQTLSYASVVQLAATKFRECIEVSTEGIELLERTGDAWETNMARYQRANALYRAGRFREAAADAQRIHDSGVVIGDDQAAGISLDVWVRSTPNKIPPEIVAQQARIHRTDAQSHAQTHLALAIVQINTGMLEEAVVTLQGAIDTCKKAGHLNTYISPCYAWLATTLRRIASSTPRFQVHLFRKQIAEARHAARIACRIARKFPADLPHALRELALVELLTGRTSVSAKLFRKSVERAERLQSPMQAWESLNCLKEMSAGEADTQLQLTEPESSRLDFLSDSLADSIRCVEGNITSQETLSLADRFDTLLADGRRITRSLYKRDIFREGCLAAQHLLRGQVVVVFSKEPGETGWTVSDNISTDTVCSMQLDGMANSGSFLARSGDEATTRVMPWNERERFASGSLLVTPIQVRDAIVAYLVVGHTELENLFGNEELKVAEFIATLTGAALENAEGFSELHKLNSTLEDRVEERTAAAELRSTELIHSNEALRETEEQLREAIEIANAASQAKSRFLATMSHEIRTPLNGILGMTQLALAKSCSPQLTNYLSTIQRSGESLLRLLNDLLDFSKIEAGKMTVESIAYDPLEVCVDAISLLSVPAWQKGIELAAYFSPSIPKSLVGDPMKLRQVVLNLLGNAIKFTSKGHVEIRVEVAFGEHAALVIRVIDTGIGIPEDKLNSIFESFSQADNSTTRRFGGTGLGLSISSELVQLMGGTIQVSSQPEFGSEFTVVLPFILDLSPVECVPLKRFPGMKFLVLDPCEAARRCLEQSITDCGGFAVSFDTWFDKPTQDRPDYAFFDAILAAGPEANEMIERASENGIPCWHAQGPDAPQDANQRYLVKPYLGPAWFEPVMSVLSNQDQPVASTQAIPNEIPGDGPSLSSDLEANRSLNILVAEDGLVNQCVLVGLLELSGHRATVANNGQEAFDLIERQSFDICLMDLDMPELDGIQATILIRSRGYLLPIYAMTAHHDQDHADKSRDAGMTGFLTKPINPKDLLRILKSVADTMPSIN